MITLAEPLIGESGSVVVTATSSYQCILTENWGVKTDAAVADWGATDPLFFIGDPLFPAVGAFHPRNSVLQFKTFKSATQVKANYWVFSGMQFSTEFVLFDRDRYDNSTEAQRSWAFNTISKVLFHAPVSDPTGAGKYTRPVDETTFPFSASPEPVAIKETGEPIAGLTKTRYIPVCTYVRNELTPPATLLTAPLVGTVNTDTLTIDGLSVPPRTCLVQDVKISETKKSLKADGTTTEFRTVTYVLAIDTEGWDIDVLQAGFYSLQPKPSNPLVATTQRIKVYDGWDEDSNKLRERPASTPQLIDVDGNWIDTAPDTGSPTWMNDVHYRVFRVHRYAPLASLGFT